MEEQKTGKWFIVFMILLIIWLFVYFRIKNNWVNISKSIDEVLFDGFFEDSSLSFDLEVSSEKLFVWELTDLSVSAIKHWEIFNDFTWVVIFSVIDVFGNYLDPDYYTVPDNWFYEFSTSDFWKKDFVKEFKIDKTWSYVLVVDSLFDEWCSWSLNVVVYDK